MHDAIALAFPCGMGHEAASELGQGDVKEGLGYERQIMATLHPFFFFLVSHTHTYTESTTHTHVRKACCDSVVPRLISNSLDENISGRMMMILVNH